MTETPAVVTEFLECFGWRKVSEVSSNWYQHTDTDPGEPAFVYSWQDAALIQLVEGLK